MRFLLLFALYFLRAAGSLIAKHQLVQVGPGGEIVIRLDHFDDSDAASVTPSELTFKVESVPSDGWLYQLSSVYSKHGYEPKVGTLIKAGSTIVTGSDHRIIYKRPLPDSEKVGQWDSFVFTVSNGRETSNLATVTVVPKSGAISGSDFLLGPEGWTVVGNRAAQSAVTFEAFSRDRNLNHYILSSDDKIDVQAANADDTSLWYFNSPTKFLGDMGIAYNGALQFTMSAFSGDFDKSNGGSSPVVKLYCASCEGPVGPGITLVYPRSALKTSFNGGTTQITISLNENAGWLKDPQNSLVAWMPPSKCDIIQVLFRLSGMQILGDWTTWHESVALDNVVVVNTRSYLPVCAQSRPDASVCTC